MEILRCLGPLKALIAMVPGLYLALAPPAVAQSPSCVEASVTVPETPVAVDVLGARRGAVLEAIGGGVAIVPAVSPSRRPGGYPVPSSDFEYLTGLELSNAWLVLIAPAQPDGGVTLFIEPHEVSNADARSVAELTGIAEVRSLADVADRVGGQLHAGDSATPATPLYLTMGMGGSIDAAIASAIDTAGLHVENLRPVLASLRVVKDEEELARLRVAAELSAKGALKGMLTAEPGLGESDIQDVIEEEFRSGGAHETSFPSIVASGANALELHYSDNLSTLVDGQLLLTDVGAEYRGYAGDVTRTYPVSGRFSDRQRELYELVLSTQEAAIRAVRPGVTIEELNRIARQHMRTHSGEICGEQSCERFFVHGLSHHLGLDVHDPGIPNLPLAPGMVLTIEPGIYIPDEEIGIRIEDDVLVTTDGHEILSTSAPKQVAAIEQAMSGGS